VGKPAAALKASWPGMSSPRIGRSEERPSLDGLWGRGKGEGRSKGSSSRSIAQRIPPIRNCATTFQRAGFLHAQGYRIARATNGDFDRNLDGVVETILAQLTASPSSWPSPRTRGEGTKAAELRPILEAPRPDPSPGTAMTREASKADPQTSCQHLSL
jgi:hypothetical protein